MAEDDPVVVLLAENKRLRAEFGVVARAKHAQETVDWLEKENEILRRQLEIHRQWTLKMDTEEGRQEILFALQLFSSIPLPVWTSDLDERITSWNRFAEIAYGYPVSRALGRNFVDLFVKPPEQQQAREDLFAIVHGQEGEKHLNLCKDTARDHHTLYLVTCCFPVYDPRHHQIAQSEISFNLSGLEELQAELHEMYERFKRKQEESERLRSEKNRALIASLTDSIVKELEARCAADRQALERKIEASRIIISKPSVTAAETKAHSMELAKSEVAMRNLVDWEMEMKERIEESPDTRPDLESVRTMIRKGWTRGA